MIHRQQVLVLFLCAGCGLPRAGADDDPDATAKARQKRLDAQFQESLGWYEVSANRNSRAILKPRPVLRWTNPTRKQEGEPTLIFWIGAGRPEALASVYPWQGSLVYECVSLARTEGLIAREDGRVVWSPRAPGVTFRDVPEAPAPAELGPARLLQAKAIAERFKVAITGADLSSAGRESMRLLPKPIFRYEMAEAKTAHADLVDGAVFAFVQGTDPEAVLLLEAVRRSDRRAWQYAFGRATGYGVEARLGPSVVWTAPGQNAATWGDPSQPQRALGRPLAD